MGTNPRSLSRLTNFAASSLHSPRILYLDEPAIGLDVAVKARIRQFISHIDKVVFVGSLQAVKTQFDRSRAVHFKLREVVAGAESITQTALNDVAPSAALNVQDYDVSVTFDPTQTTTAKVVGAVKAALPVDDLNIQEPGIESIIRQLYEGKLKFGMT